MQRGFNNTVNVWRRGKNPIRIAIFQQILATDLARDDSLDADAADQSSRASSASDSTANSASDSNANSNESLEPDSDANSEGSEGLRSTFARLTRRLILQ